VPKQDDVTLTKPGLTFVIHLGHDTNDIVYVDFEHDTSKRYPCRPGTAYLFPGYAVRHRTQREYAVGHKDPKSLPRRYSIGVWFPFKRASAKKMDDLIHKVWPFMDDNYADRYKHPRFQV